MRFLSRYWAEIQRAWGCQPQNTPRGRKWTPRVELLEVRTLLAAGFPEFIDPNPSPGNQFGHSVVPLSTGNVVITAPFADVAGADAGAVYLFNGQTGALISTLRGSSAGDQIGLNGIITLPSGNFLIRSPLWDYTTRADAGAVTWGSGTTGISGTVSESNSLVGTTAGDVVGNVGITVLSNGNYVVRSPLWDNGVATDAGAVTWGSGTTGVKGAVSASNSLVGTTSGDVVGNFSVTTLSNGNYVVSSPVWDNGVATDAGAVTWGNGATGIKGAVSESNSLVGTTSGDVVGNVDLTALSNGNYVVRSPVWNNGLATDAGAVTWGNGATGIAGVVSESNSLVGTTTGDVVGNIDLTALDNGNYVVRSPVWDNGLATDAGAVTWGSGTTGIKGTVSASNSLVGTTNGDVVGNQSVTVLENGNYVVNSPNWDNGTAENAGAVTWGNGATGITGAVSASNSLVGTADGDVVGNFNVTILSNGNYVVSSPYWDNGSTTDAGAATWGSGTTGVTGAVNALNSLVGTTIGDNVGYGNANHAGVTALNNGNYVVYSVLWNNGASTNAGAVTWGNGSTGITGAVSASNSLVGTTENDIVGNFGVRALSNGNYIVLSPYWQNGGVFASGAVTWGNGTIGVTGAVSATNSLVGTSANDLVGGSSFNDFVGGFGFVELSNGNYVVGSPRWNNGAATEAGAVTWGNGATGISGAVSASNSLVGTTRNDNVGGNGVTALSNGNYIVSSPLWNNGSAFKAGAATWGNGSTGIVGIVSSFNSLVGTTRNDFVGGNTVTGLSNGNYIVSSPAWNNVGVADVGAVTWGNGSTGIMGAVSASNSLVGTDSNDLIGNNGVTVLSNGNYIIRNPLWNNGPTTDAGAMTFGSGTNGVVGTINSTNSALGLTATTNLQGPVLDNPNATFYGKFLAEGGGRVRVGSQTSGFAGSQHPPIISGLPTNQSVNDNATISPFSSIVVNDPDNQNMLAKVTILNGAVRGDFTPASVTGWTRSVSGNNIVYTRFYNPQANIGSVVQAALRNFVFVPRNNAIKPNTTELTDITVFVNDGIANTTATTRLVTTSVNNAPTIGGASNTVAVNDNATVNPLATLTVIDADMQEMLISVTILNGVNRGDFTNANAGTGWTVRQVLGNNITYKRYFGPQTSVGAAAQAAFRALIFQPRQNAIKPGITELTDFQVTVSDGVAAAVANTGTRVTTTSVNNAPTIAGAVANQTMNDNQTKAVFSTLTVSDPDTQDQFVRITITNGTTRGDFTAPSTIGWTRKVSGTNILYERFFAAANNNGAVVQTAIRALVFQPRTNVPIGTSETTSFTVFVNDGLANATSSITSVITTGVAPRAAAAALTIPPVLDVDVVTIVVPSVKRAPANPLARLLRKSR